MHLFMEDSGESDGPDARRHDKIALVSNDTAIAMREDSIYIRNFCSLTANTCSHIYHTRGELSVSGETPAVTVCIRESILPLPYNTNCSNLCTYCITNSQFSPNEVKRKDTLQQTHRFNVFKLALRGDAAKKM